MRVSIALKREIDQGIIEAAERRADEEQALEKKRAEQQVLAVSAGHLVDGVNEFRKLYMERTDDFVGFISGGAVCSHAESEPIGKHTVNVIRLSPGNHPTAVFGDELRILSTVDGMMHYQSVYLGSQPVAEFVWERGWEGEQGWHRHTIFSKAVTQSDYCEFKRRILEIAGNDLGSRPKRSLPSELVAEAEVERQKILQDSLAACSSMLESATGQLKGTVLVTNYGNGQYSTRAHFIEDINGPGEKEKFFEHIACGAGPIFDNSLTEVFDTKREAYYLGAKEIANYYHNYERGGHSYQIMEHSVTEADYKQFVDQVKALLAQKGIEQKSELPAELKTELSRFQMNRTLLYATEVQEGWTQLRRIYGDSHFGSGGGYGSVQAYDLDDWRKGTRRELPLETKTGDDGFVVGPKAVKIKPGMIVLARGGDYIGEGRSWAETYRCEGQSSDR